jgi:hypothetical protein
LAQRTPESTGICAGVRHLNRGPEGKPADADADADAAAAAERYWT